MQSKNRKHIIYLSVCCSNRLTATFNIIADSTLKMPRFLLCSVCSANVYCDSWPSNNQPFHKPQFQVQIIRSNSDLKQRFSIQYLFRGFSDQAGCDLSATHVPAEKFSVPGQTISVHSRIDFSLTTMAASFHPKLELQVFNSHKLMQEVLSFKLSLAQSGSASWIKHLSRSIACVPDGPAVTVDSDKPGT